MNLQRATDFEPAPLPVIPCSGLRCSQRRTCALFAFSDFAPVWVMRIDHCRDRQGNTTRFVECAPVRPLSYPATDWGGLTDEQVAAVDDTAGL